MTKSGYPTPDNPTVQTFTNVCITIPSSIEDVFYSVLLGQISEMANEYYWKPEGGMSPEEAAFLWSQTLAMTPANLEECTTMTCEEVADCIENDISTQTAIADAINNNSDIQSAISNTTRNNPSDGAQYWSSTVNYLADNIIPSGALCTEANKYAMSLAIVRALNQLAVDFLEIIEVITNPSEIGAELLAGVPIFGGAASLTLDTANWLQDNIKEVYDAAYNASSEEHYACAIYCMFTDCNLSYEDMIIGYENGGTISPPQDTDFITVMQWLITNIVPVADRKSVV